MPAGPLGAQDSIAAPDTSRIARLRTLDVSVTRAPERRLSLPATVGLVDSAAFRGGQLQNGLDETLGRVPGVYAVNRFNPSLDQRLAIRGAGARANFGVRGLKILLDGIPQTLPDGQSQLTNVDFAMVDQAEVLLGAASALYGNAGGGVIAFGTAVPAGPATLRVRALGGSFGTSRAHIQAGGSSGLWSGSVGATRFDSDGARQHSATRAVQVTAGVNRVLADSWLLRARYYLADSPRARNPGALTLAEYLANPDSAAPNNVLRGADKSVRQHQAGLTLSRDDGAGTGIEAAVFGLTRTLVNPLATAPPGPSNPVSGTYSTIDRRAGGARLGYRRALDDRGNRLAVGADVQFMGDDRRNRRSRGGAPTDTLTADQRETTSEVGPYLSLHLEPWSGVVVTGTGRYDRVSFRVLDRFDGDGVDQSGVRTMSAASGSVGMSVAAASGVSVYGNLATAFETPTSTELVSQPSGTIGLNAQLGPQRTITTELGVRTAGPLALSGAVYRSAVRDALIQARERDGRAVFENAGRLVIRGVEAGLEWRPLAVLGLTLAYSHTDARFAAYRVRNGAVVDTLDGNQVPGIPRHLLRAVASVHLGRFDMDVDQQVVSRFFADDRNLMPVEGWGAGITALRVHYRVPPRHTGPFAAVAPFASVSNLWNRRYLAAATVNGFGGRVFEPGASRWVYLGLDLSVALQRPAAR